MGSEYKHTFVTSSPAHVSGNIPNYPVLLALLYVYFHDVSHGDVFLYDVIYITSTLLIITYLYIMLNDNIK